MLKFGMLVVGMIVGGVGVGGWLLSEPGASQATPQPVDPRSLEGRLQTVRARFQRAQEEGKRAGAQTEQQLQQKLDAYRSPNQGSNLPVARSS